MTDTSMGVATGTNVGVIAVNTHSIPPMWPHRVLLSSQYRPGRSLCTQACLQLPRKMWTTMKLLLNCTTQELSTEHLTRPQQASTARQHSTAHSTKQPSLSARRCDPSLPITTNLGDMSAQCTFCRATKKVGLGASLCCCNGKVQLDPLHNPPEPLKTLYLGDTCESKHFLRQGSTSPLSVWLALDIMRYESLGGIQVLKFKARLAIDWVVCAPCLMRSPSSHKSPLWMIMMYRQPPLAEHTSSNTLSLIYSACSMLTTVMCKASKVHLSWDVQIPPASWSLMQITDRQGNTHRDTMQPFEVAVVLVVEEHGIRILWSKGETTSWKELLKPPWIWLYAISTSFSPWWRWLSFCSLAMRSQYRWA